MLRAWLRRFLAVDPVFLFLTMEFHIMSAEFDALVAQVTANEDVEKAAAALIQGLAAQIGANAEDPAKVVELTGRLKASADALAQAITANTPAAPAPQPEPEQPQV